MKKQMELKKSINWVKGTAITIGAVLGSGILALPAIAAQLAGPGSIISWVLMGIVSIPMITVIAMMSSKYPSSGGMADYVRRGFGDRFGKVAGLITLSAMPFGMPITALIGANYLGTAFSFSSLTVHIIAAAMILLAVYLNYRGIELSGKVQVAVVAIIIMILLFTVGSSISSIKIAEFSPFFSKGFKPVFTVMNLLFFAFVGWEIVGNMAEEFYNPRKDIPLSLFIGFAVIIVLYLAIALVTVGSGLYKTCDSSAVMISLVEASWGKKSGIIMAFLAAIICYCAIHTYIAGFSRLVYSEAREGDFPKIFAKLHQKYQSPYVALLSFVPVNLFILALSWIFSLKLDSLISIPSTAFLLGYILSMIASVKVLKSKVGKICACISTVVCIAMFIFSGKIMLYPLGVMVVALCFCKSKSEYVENTVNENLAD